MIRSLFHSRATLFATLLLACGSAQASTYTGNSAYDYDSNNACSAIHTDNGDFNDPKNWGSPCSPGTVPGPGETADLAGHGVHATSVNTGTLIVNGGGLTADSITLDNLTLSSGAVAGNGAGASTLTVSTAVNWTGGHISTITATFAPTCTATVSGTNTSGTIEGEKILNGAAILHNQGTINWSGDPISGFGGGSGTLDNSGTFNMLSDGSLGDSLSGYGITLVNSGLFDKTGGSGNTNIGAANGFVNNGGVVQAQTGIFDPSPAYSSTAFNGGTIAAGAGVVQLSSGWILNGDIVVNGTLRITGGSSGGPATFSGPGTIDWQGGGFADAYNDAAGVYHEHSSRTFAPDMHVNMSGAGTKTFGPLTNEGTLTWSAPGPISGTLTNQGHFNLLTDGALGGSFTTINTGTIAKTGGSGELTTGGHLLDNSGVIDVQTGSLILSYNQYSNDFFRDKSMIQGAGKLVSLNQVFGEGVVNVNGTFQMGDNSNGTGYLYGGTLGGTGTIEWLGGSFDSVTFASGFTVNASGDTGKGFAVSQTNSTPSTLAGVLNWRGGAAINFDGYKGPHINSGTINVLAAGTFGGGKLTNQGTFNTFPGGTTAVSGTFLNSGTLNLGTASAPGELSLSQTDFTNTGTLNVGIKGAAAGQFSDLTSPSNGNGVTNIHLGGTLGISYASGFKPVDGNSFPIVQNLSRTNLDGTFQTVNGLTASNGRSLKVRYNPLDVTLELVPLPTLSINSPSITEGNSGTSNLTFTATLSASSSQPVTVKYATADGTALKTKDYTITSGTLTIAAGATKGTFAVPIIGDTIDEPNETFNVNLTSPTNATLTTALGVGTIVDNDSTPSLKINDVTVTEGNSSTIASFTVTLSAPSGQTVKVNYATADSTAVAPGDYTARTGTLTFAPGVTTQPVNVAIKGDVLDEINEQFKVVLSTPVNAGISDTTGIGTITDDDATPTLSINSLSISEGNSGTKVLTFTVKLSRASGQIVTVNGKTSNATINPATAGTDYIALAATKLTFVAGEISKTFSVTIKGDTLDEADEKFNVLLSAPTNATITTATGVGTILDDDAAPSLSINSPSITEGNSGTKVLNFTVKLSAASSNSVTVKYATGNATTNPATAGTDYLALTGKSLTFAPGVVSQTIAVTVNGDPLDEADELFNVVLSSPTSATILSGSGTGVGTILDDDATPSLSIADASITEGNSGTGLLNFTVTLSAKSGRAVTANYATANGTAQAGTDYVTLSGPLSFAPGETIKTVSVKVNGDIAVEANETFKVTLGSAVNATLARGTATGTITNDDASAQTAGIEVDHSSAHSS